MDLFVGYEKCGYLFEFGLEKRKNAEKCIEAIFTKKYYEIFQNPKSKGPYEEKFLFGVSMNAKSSENVSGLKVMRLKSNGNEKNQADWENII